MIAGRARPAVRPVTMPRFDVPLLADQHQRITETVVVPPIVHALAKHPAVDHYDLSSLEWLGCGAAPLSAALQQACAQRIGRPVVQGYGMTEATAGIALLPLDTPVTPGRRAAAARRPGPRTDPTTGADLAPGEAGELWLRPGGDGRLSVNGGQRGHRRPRRLAAHRRHRPHRRGRQVSSSTGSRS